MVTPLSPLPAMTTTSKIRLIVPTLQTSRTELVLVDSIVRIDIVALLRHLQYAPAGTESKIAQI